MQKTFETIGPISLYVELGSGDLTVNTHATTQTEVHVDGRDADDVIVEQRGDQVVVLASRNKRAGFFSNSGDLSVRVSLPLDSNLSTKLGSADMVATGRYGEARVKSGSGDLHIDDLTGDAVIETGSGDIDVSSSLGDLKVKSGSGDVSLERLAGSTVVSTGSGDVSIGGTEDSVAVKSGSGSIQIADAHTDLTLSTASGDVYVARIRSGGVQASAVSGDVRLGIPAGIPVWTDVKCVSGSVRSNLEGAGQPEEGQDFIEVRASTVSGDIALEQL